MTIREYDMTVRIVNYCKFKDYKFIVLSEYKIDLLMEIIFKRKIIGAKIKFIGCQYIRFYDCLITDQ